MYMKYKHNLNNTVVYSNHVNFMVNTLLERLVTYNALEFWIHPAFIFQMTSYTTLMFIFSTASIGTMHFFLTLYRTIAYNDTINKKTISISHSYTLTKQKPYNKAPTDAKTKKALL